MTDQSTTAVGGQTKEADSYESNDVELQKLKERRRMAQDRNATICLIALWTILAAVLLTVLFTQPLGVAGYTGAGLFFFGIFCTVRLV